MNKINYKRIYELDDSDKQRVLVDRLWPRGKSKEELKITYWAKDITPTNKLRQDYHKGKISYLDFAASYQAELDNNELADSFIDNVKGLLEKDDVTVTYAAKDVEMSHMPTLRKFIADKI